MDESKPVPKELLERIKQVKNKRAKFVLDQIVKNGIVSTIDIKNAGYDHPPRAVMDAKDLGFAIESVQAKRDDGQNIAAYQFEEAELDPNKTGRVLVPKKDREALIAAKGAKCNMCGCQTNLQIDHRIPFVVAGESQRYEADPYQILDGSCNRRKSWACEHCDNWLTFRRFETCLTCYWANPENYTHVAMRLERRIDIVWIGGEVDAFETLKAMAIKNGRSVPDQIKAMLIPKQ